MSLPTSSQISDITQDNEPSSSSSSEDEDVLALEHIKELPESEKGTPIEEYFSKNHKGFLEDQPNFRRGSNPQDLKFATTLQQPLLQNIDNPPPTQKIKYKSKKIADKPNSFAPVHKGKTEDRRSSTPDVLEVSEINSIHPKLNSMSSEIQTNKIKALNDNFGVEDDEESDSSEEQEKVTDFIRTKKILRDVFPTFLFSAVQLIQETIVLQFIGHYGTSLDFAAVSLGNLWVNVTGYVMIYGFTASLATLGSHASGKGNAREVGHQFHQCILFTMILTFFAICLNFYVKNILVFAGQPVDIAEAVPTYTWPLSIGLIPYALISSTVNYLEAQQIYDPPSYSTVISFIFHPFLCWLLIGYFDMGTLGGGLALCIVQIIDIILLVVIIRFRPVYYDEVKESLFWPSRKSLEGFSVVLKVGFSSLILTCIEWWAIEYTTMLAGWCGEVKLSAHTICVQIMGIVSMVAASFGTIIQTYLGYALGEYNKREFIAICRLGPFLGFLFTTVLMIGVVALRHEVPKLFTNEEDVITSAADLMLLSIAYSVFDTSQVLFGSIMKGIGRYNIAIWSSVIPYYMVGIPLSYILAFRYRQNVDPESIKGIWAGILFGIVFCNVIYVIVLFRLNLKREMDKFTREAEPMSSGSSFNHMDLVDMFLEKKKKKEFNLPHVISVPRVKFDFRQRRFGR